MRKLNKVGHVLRRFNPEAWGGTESVVYHTSIDLISRGIASSIFCTDMLSKEGKAKYGLVEINRYSYVFPWFGLSSEAKRQLELKGGSPLSLSLFFGLLREPNLSVIHLHVLHRLGGIARTVAWLRGIPYVVSLHGGYHQTPQDELNEMEKPFSGKWEWGKLFGWILGSRRVLLDADAIICVGRQEFEQTRARYPKKRVVYLPNGVDIARYESGDPSLFRAAFKLPPEKKLLLCVSRIDYQKNQLLLVDAFARIANDLPDYQLVMVGSVSISSYYEKISKRIRFLGLESRILIVPGLQPDDPLLASVYKAADIFVLPSRHEPFGIVILEAWAAKTPVIASAVGGIPGFTRDGENVVLFESDNREALARSILSVAQNNDLRSALIKNGAETVQGYDWRHLTDQLVALYEELLSG